MDRLIRMKESLTNAVEGQISGHLTEADAKELGEAVDMIKDLAEAIYYCTITEAMKEDEEEKKIEKRYRERYSNMYSTPMRYHYPPEYYDPRYRDTAYRSGGNSGMSGSSSGSNGGSSSGSGSSNYSSGNYTMYTDGNYMMRDEREGRSPMRRKMYMEGKMTHKDKNKQMQELENYMHELSTDLAEMVQDASPEEKQLLQQKISMLASKIK